MKLKSKDFLGFNKEKLTKWFLYWTVLSVGLFVLVFLITSTWIGVSVREYCQTAQGKYEGDCVEALIQVVESEESSFRERNHAIWSLGQLGDARALNVLQSLYTGVISEREPYDDGVSQYELKKAIRLIDSGFNATAFVWRRGF